MKKKVRPLLAALITMLLVTGPAFGHTLFMNLTDNGDGTVSVEGMFSTGATAANLPLYLLDENEKQILKIKLDENGEAEFTIPDQPYTVFLDGGPGHTIREDGPMRK
ncbi:hypothetical protein [Desulfobacter sp.]|uniref:hypothetical protein n=1 Tax=Desulfobacter sp. TaxID=2294 RepID=UPI000E999077|nr:hypothetical protein [Desulfobacter sp.]HBT89065.1 hypothetical protein [Desulfobacter sp.]